MRRKVRTEYLSRSGKLRTNSSVFSWRLKDASEDNDMRDLDKLFHVRAAATGKARSPAVERRVGGTTSIDDDDERRRWRAGRSDTRSRSRDKYDGARPFRQRKKSTESTLRLLYHRQCFDESKNTLISAVVSGHYCIACLWLFSLWYLDHLKNCYLM